MRSGKTCSGPEKQAPKTYSNCRHCGPERHAAVRKSKHPKRTLIVDITVRKDMQRSGKEDSTRQRWRQTEGERERERQREEEGEERESVVNGEQRMFQSGFRPLFVLRLPQLWRKNRKKTRKERREGRKRQRQRRSLETVSRKMCRTGFRPLLGPVMGLPSS